MFPALPGDKFALRASEFLFLRKRDKPRILSNPGLVYPGSYLLSRDLSSDKTPEGSEGGWTNTNVFAPQG